MINLKQALPIITIAISIVAPSFAGYYQYLEKLGKDSILYKECEQNNRGWIFKNNTEKACGKLEEQLKKWAETDIEEGLPTTNTSHPLAQAAGMFTYLAYRTEKESAIKTVLANHDDEIKFTEDEKFDSVRSRLRAQFENCKKVAIQHQQEKQAKRKYPR